MPEMIQSTLNDQVDSSRTISVKVSWQWRSMGDMLVLAIIGCLFFAEVSYAEEPQTNNSTRAIPLESDHWSFEAIDRPSLPKSKIIGWTRNGIDSFILAKCRAKGQKPLAAAHRTVLVRRLYLSLLGLPPTPKQVSEFVNDPRKDAYEILVDRLLASPQYGQKWAQHWLDLARFAETDGFEHDKVRAGAWRYRDWVIHAFNSDRPYDQFLGMQLAGDEQKGNLKQSVATMYCLSGPDMPDINSQEERRQNVLNELTGTIGATLLGLQVSCAQCHDHKFDPISQKDFYQLRSIFEPALKVKKNQSLAELGESSAKAGKSYLMIRGDWQRQGPEIIPGIPRVLDFQDHAFQVKPRKQSTGRRLAFANWLLHRQNPLTSRVLVNRLWQYHFGQGLVTTPNDFGLMGEPPSHPKLLDWLAVELMDNDWSIKHIQRLILNSATFRQQPSKAPKFKELLVGFPRQRLSGEIIRDAMLQVSETLDFHMGGRGVMPPIPEEMKKTLLKNQWNTSKTLRDHYRRSIYVFARRNLRYPLFEAFDRPDGNATCPRRNQSTTAPQSLHLLNSEFSLDAAKRLASLLIDNHDELNHLLKAAFARVMARDPSARELETLRQFVSEQVAELAQLHSKELAVSQMALPIPSRQKFDPATQVAIVHLCLALFNTNEFLYFD